MKKTLLLLMSIFVFGLGSNSFGQCSVDPTYADSAFNFYPNPAPTGCVGEPYDQVIQVVFPVDTTITDPITLTVPFDSFIVQSITNVPPGLSIAINALDSAYLSPGGGVPAQGCAHITGTPTAAYGSPDSVLVTVEAFLTVPFIGSTSAVAVIPLAIAVLNPISNYTFTTSSLMATFSDASTGDSAWVYDFGDGNTSTMQNPVHTYAANGDYEVCLYYGTSCVDTFCDSVSVSAIVGIENHDISEFGVWPNPTQGRLNIGASFTSSEEIEIKVTDLMGRRVYFNHEAVAAGYFEKEIDLTGLATGGYMVSVASGNDFVSRIVYMR